MDSFWTITVILLCLCLEGLFSGGEIAYVVADINRIRQRAKEGSHSALLAQKLLERPDWFISTTLTGTNLCIVTSTIMATALFISMYGTERGELISTLMIAPTLLIMIVTRSLFQQHAEKIAVKIAWFIWAASWVLFPVVYLVSKISRGTVLLSSGEHDLAYSPYITKHGLKSILVNEPGKSDILRTERDMVRRIFDFTGITAGEIMVPLSAINALPVTATLKEAALFAADKKHLRLPVYRDQMFNIVGILHYFDLLECLRKRELRPGSEDKITIEECLKPVEIYVPETKQAKELLVDLESKNEHMAVVVDEYGGVIGIVTIEDILEEIVGEIEDEYDSRKTLYRKTGSNRYLFDAQISLEKIRQVVPVAIPDGDYETLAGFLLARMGKVPRRRETLRAGNALYVIEDADLKSIKEVMVVITPPGDR